MADKVQLIKEEIERRFNDNMKASEQYTEKSKSRALFTSAAKEDYDLLAFVDSLPEEPTKEDLEEEIDRYYSDWQFDDDTIYEDMRDICRHFAEWGRNHFEDKSEMVSEGLEEAANQHSKQVFHGLLVEDNITAFKAGAEWQKQQMMKDAVDGEVVYQIGSSILAPTDIRYKVVSDRVYIPNVKLGDKVKIIIVKEE